MEDECSSKAVTLLPDAHGAAAAAPTITTVATTTATTTPPPPPSQFKAEWAGGGGAAGATMGSVTPTSSGMTRNNADPSFTSSTPDGSPQARPQQRQHSSATHVAATTVSRESDSNEEPLFQHPPPIAASLPHSGGLSPAMRPWSAVSATPPSSVFAAGPNCGAGGLFPATALHAESSSTPAGQSIAVGRDLSNLFPSTSAMKQRPAGGSSGAAAAVHRSALTATYVDVSSNNTNNSTSSGSDVIVGHTGSHATVGRTTGFGANRSLFRSVAPQSGAVPVSPVIAASRWDQRQRDESSGGGGLAMVATPLTPALAGTEAVLVREPPTPAKQRRTIHTGGGAGAYGDGAGLGFGTRVSGALSGAASAYYGRTPSSMAANGGGGASPAKGLTRTTAPPPPPPAQPSRAAAAVGGSGTSPSTVSPPPLHSTPLQPTNFIAAPSMSFKFPKREGSRKRSADVLSQFSALDLDETPATPFGRFNSLGGGTAFPSQPAASMAALRSNSAVVPTSPLMAGYATPVTLSQQIGGSNTFSQMLLHPSQDVLDMSQADTECSNFLARRIVNDYNEVRLLGRGSFGTVSLYKEISSGDYVAVKMSPPLRAPDMERRYRRERSVMGMVRGMPHVVQLSAAWEEGRIPRMYLQLEYCPGGSLAALAATKQTRNEPWPEEEVKTFLAHMSIALDALHRANIAHVDFKPDNVLIDKDGAYKLSDFGCSVLLDAKGRPRPETQNGYGTAASPSRVHPRGNGGASTNGVGSFAYRRDGADAGGPLSSVADFHWNEGNETSTASVDEGDCRYLCADMLNEKRHFKAGDMFSLGMSLYELMSGQPLPRNGDQFLALRRQVPTEMLLRRGYSAMLVRLVVALLHSDPTQRPTARQVLQFLRPSAAEMQLLTDPSAMQQWTTSAESFAALLTDPRRQHEESQARESAALRPSAAALRCVSALMEGSCWLLTTTQQDVHRTLTTAAEGESGDEEAERHRQPTMSQPARSFPPLPPPRGRRGDVLGPDLDDLPMSPIMREEACTPTTLNY